MIELHEVTKSYGFRDPTLVLDAVSLIVPKGAVVGVLGPSGVGKTTLLRIIAGTLRPTSGTVRVDGNVLPEDVGRIRPLVAYVPEREHLEQWENARDYLEFWARVGGLGRKERKQRIAESSVLAGLPNPDDVSLIGVTIDLEMRLKLARALLTGPEVILLDEPLTGSGLESQRFLADTLRALGKTIVMTSSTFRDIRLVCDRTAVLSEGKILGDLPTKELLDLIGRGRHARIFIETETPDAAAEALHGLGLEGVVETITAREVAVIYVIPGQVELNKVKATLAEQGVRVRRVRESEVALGDVFRALYAARGG